MLCNIHHSNWNDIITKRRYCFILKNNPFHSIEGVGAYFHAGSSLAVVSDNFMRITTNLAKIIVDSARAFRFAHILCRAETKALIGGGVYIHIFAFCPTNFF